MTPQELIEMCKDMEALGQEIQLVLDRKPTGSNMRLFGSFGPISNTILCVNSDGNTVATFDPKKVRLCVERELKNAT